MTNEKFKLLTDDTINFLGNKLYRIEALKDFGDVKKGEKGGYVQNESNLSSSGNSWVYDNARVYGDAYVSHDAWVYGNAQVSGDAWVFGDALIDSMSPLIVIGPIGSENGTLTAYKNNKGGISVNRGCFSGTLEEFEKAVDETHGDNKHAKTYKLAIELIKSRLEE